MSIIWELNFENGLDVLCMLNALFQKTQFFVILKKRYFNQQKQQIIKKKTRIVQKKLPPGNGQIPLISSSS